MVLAEYETVFQIGFRSFAWSALLHPLAFVVIGILLFRFAKIQIYKGMGVIIAALATLIVLVATVRLAPDFVKLRHAYRSGDNSVVEGIVEDYRPAPSLGAADESFSVDGVHFSYNVLDTSPCFHNAPAHKGPVRPGLGVRIYYKDGCIQRVDIRRQSSR
jgi:hypothetical protein